MKSSFRLLCALLAVSLVPTAAICGTLPELKTKVRALAAFKNGLGFVYRSGQTQLADGWALTEPVPPAGLGSLWIGAVGVNPVTEVVSYRDTVSDAYDAIDAVELLAANVGKEVSITWGDDKTLVGKVISVPKPRVPDLLGSFPNDGRSIYGDHANIVLLEVAQASGKRIVSIDRRQIQQVEFPGDASLKTTIERSVNRAKVRVAGSPKQAEITLAYLTRGITWSPSYLINITDPTTATITLDAVLASDTEDLENTDVSFVVGYPNFMYSDTVTPLSLQQQVTSFVESLERMKVSQSSPAMAQVLSNYYYGAAAVRVGNTATPEQMAGESSEDLFFYQQKGVTLKKGDRARYSVFTEKAPYEHVYQWDIADNMNVDDRGYRVSSDTQKEDVPMVWHSLKLTNKTGKPWTTAPAFTIREDLPVAQDMMRYTPAGSDVLVKLTLSGDVRAEAVQTESSRKQVTVLRQDYDDVTVGGKLLLRNGKNEPVKVVVTKDLVGEVLTAGQGGKVEKVAKRIAAVNPNSQIKWELTLGAGKEIELTYQYHVIVGR